MTAQPDWFNNDALFRRELETGHTHASRVAGYLRANGIAVTVTPMEWRKMSGDRHAFRDEYDLLVGERQPCRVDVKSRNLTFTSPDDYPYDTAFVDTVSGWDRKQHKPLAIVLVSQRTNQFAVIAPSTQPLWGRTEKVDRVRGITDTFYVVRRDDLRPIDQLVAWLHIREGATPTF